MGKPLAFTSLMSPIRGTTSLKLMERATYSALVVDMAVIVCILDAQVMGHPVNCITYPAEDLVGIGSLAAYRGLQLHAESEST